MRAAIYTRMSQDRSGEGLGVDRQREDCAALIDRRGWSVVGEQFVDNDRSAAGRKPRPAFRRLLDAIGRAEVDVIVAWALDRLARTARDRLTLIEACREHSVMIALVRGSDIDLTTPAGRLTAGVLGEVAQHEIDAKSDRQVRAAEQAAKAGRWIGGRKPFGYAPNGVDIVLDEAAAIRDGYAAVLSGVSLRAIATEWNALGLTTGQAPWRHVELGDRSPWRADSVRRVLLNPRYAGIRAHSGQETAPACWAPIVPEETYRAAAALLGDRERRTGGGGARQFLTGLAECAVCGLAVHGGGAGHGKPIYRCRSSTMLPSERPTVEGTHVNRLAEPVDEYVALVVVERLTRPDAAELLIDDQRPDVAALREEARALRVRVETLAAEFGADPTIAAGEYRAMRRAPLARLEAIEAEVADAGRVDVLGPLVAADDVRGAWAALSVPRRRLVVETLMTVRLHPVGRGTRTFRPGTVDVVWRTA